ncbi:stimulated by retinoic acid gene 6 protein-like isoform X2 [Hydractinia symbiolongicarpus]|uniref:stimulated by retinoic acid gene 6 protein-like isoform X2 n=1 Tax=Hydractinia symbiolongicarpus TaxID=13093 RepID=UPI00254C625B|nr:stimulated by retinoic acid gene 6 protein-like isoform X2 [Hydractinia symbiolongicarpus]
MVSITDIYKTGVTVFKIYTVIQSVFQDYLDIDITVDPLSVPDQVLGKIDVFLSPNSTAQIERLVNKTTVEYAKIESIVRDARICVEKVVNKTKVTKSIDDARDGMCNCFNFDGHGVISPIKSFCKKQNTCLIGNWTAFVGAVLMIPAGLFLIIMTIIKKRKSCCLGSCNSHGGPVIPLNMLDSYKNRFAHAFCFCVSVSRISNVILGDTRAVLGPDIYNELSKWPPYLNLFIRAICAIVIAIVCYPLFTCLSTKRRFVGAIFGFCYCTIWFCLECWKEKQVYDCYDHDVVQNTLYLILIDLPSLVCLVVLAFIFAKIAYKCIQKHGLYLQLLLAEEEVDWQDEYFYHYTRKLLTGNKSFIATTEMEIDGLEQIKEKVQNKDGKIKTEKKFKNKIKDIMYSNVPEFRYSTRIICAIAVSAVTIYMMILIIAFFGYFVIDKTLNSFVYGDRFENILKAIGWEDYLEMFKVHFGILITCYYVSVAVGAIKVWVVITNMMSWYRKQIIKLRKGDKRWLPTSIRKAVFENNDDSVVDLVTSSMKYAGYQVSYIAWSFIVFTLMLWVGLAIAGSLVFYPLSKWDWNPPTFTWLFLKIWPVIVIAVALIISQTLASKFFFVYGDGKSLAVNNRNAFHIYSYFMFYFNIFAGLASCLTRIIFQIIFGILFLERVQKSVLPRSYEKRDPGYNAYLGYLLVEHTHANPVLTVFIHLCMDKAKHNYNAEEVEASYSPTEDGHKIQLQNRLSRVDMSKRYLIVRNRFFLMLTLIRNPGLGKYRKKERRLARKNIWHVVTEKEEIKESKQTEQNEEVYINDDINSVNFCVT